MGRASGALRIVVLGIMGRTPLAGVVWQAMHYLEGFRRLGHEVVYVEDTGAWPYDPEQNTLTEDVRYAVQTIEAVMTSLGLPDRWAYRAAPPGNRLFGLGEAELAHVCRDADVLVNVTGAAILREEYLRVPVRIYLETDPVLSQIEAAQGRESMVAMLAAHTHHFTFGENVGTSRMRAARGAMSRSSPPGSRSCSTGGRPTATWVRRVASRRSRAGARPRRTSSGTA